MKKGLLFLISILACVQLAGQDYLGEIALPPVSSTGFYRISLAPYQRNFFTTDFSNLRILDRQNNVVPYLTETAKDYLVNEFVEHRIIENKQVKNCCTTIILDNEKNASLSNLHVRIRNAEVHKQGSLRGSDDRVTWYALKERFYLGDISSAESTSELRIIGFPMTNYRYLQLWINDSASAPLNIMSVGYYKQFETTAQFQEIPRLRFTTVHDKTRTTIRLLLDTVQLIDRVQLTLSGAPVYSRIVTVYEERETKTKKGKIRHYRHELASTRFTHESANIIDIDGSRVTNLSIEIENGDNPPLEPLSVVASQRSQYIIAHLEEGKSYSLKIGGGEMLSPQYDMSYFRNQIDAGKQTIQAGKLTLFGQAVISEDAEPWITRHYMWIGIIAIIILLGLMSVKMIRETRKEE